MFSVLKYLKNLSFGDWCQAVSPFGVVLLALMLHTGAQGVVRGPMSLKKTLASEPYVDTSAYPMHPSFKGWSGDTSRALNALRAELNEIFSEREFRNVIASAKIVFFDTNNFVHDVYSHNANEAIMPASVEKLFTSSSTIWALGSKYAFTTKIDLAPGASIQGTKVIGNVYLRPSGDPTLRSSDLDLLTEQLRAKGITAIQGDIISDLDGESSLSSEAKAFIAEHDAPTHVTVRDSIVGENGLMVSADTAANSDSSADEEDEDTQAGALSMFPNFALDRNIVTVTVSAGVTKGSPLSVRVYPPISTVVISNHGSSSAPAAVRVKKIGRGRHKRTVRTVVRGTMTLHVSSTGEPMDPQQTVYISGQLPARQQRTYRFPLRNVPLAMAAVMRWRLQQGGIAVSGRPRVERASTPAVEQPSSALQTLALKQTSLLDLLEQMNKRSDNYLAECMFHKLSSIVQVAATAPEERARKLMRSWLQVCNVDGNSCTFIDGSGLSHMNRTSAQSVVDLLTAIRQQGMFELFSHTLSVAGYDGTLRHRMIGTPAQYNAHGKTGTLNGVTALAGYVLTADGQLAAYFITMQKFRGGAAIYKRDQNEIVEALASFKYDDYVKPIPVPEPGAIGKVGRSK